MIIVRRCPTNVQKLQQQIRSVTSSMTAPPPPIASHAGAGACGGGQNQNFDWAFVLSPENKTRTIEFLTIDRENSDFKFPTDDPLYRKAAVLIPICYDLKGRPSLLFQLRSANLNKHKGEISFPGGAMDPEDNDDPVAAALRETHEELGISRDAMEIWATLRGFPTISRNMGVIPVLGFIKSGPIDPTALLINPDEVDHAFTVTLEHLCDSSNWDDNDHIKKFKGRSYLMPMWKNLNVFNGSEEIHLWGLTAFITHLALSALLPSGVYKRELNYLNLELGKKSSQSHKNDDDKPTSNL